MKLKYFLFLLAPSVLFTSETFAQAPLQSLNANPILVAEASFLNPSFLKNARNLQINILPLMAAQVQASNNLVSTGALIDYLQHSEDQESSYKSIHKIINNLKPNNSVDVSTDITLFHLTLRLGGKAKSWNTGISVRQHVQASVSLNEDFITLLYEGNKQYAGKTVSLKPEFSLLGYTDIGWSLSKTIHLKDVEITPAARLRYLIGEAAVYTKQVALELYTEENGEYIDVSGKLEGNAGGVIDFGEAFSEDENEETDENMSRNAPGKGLAIDLGVNIVYKNLSFSIASIDNGKIRFKGNGTWNISSQSPSYRWEGYDIAANLNGESETSENFAPLESMDLKSRQQDFSVNIGSKFTLNGNYGIKKKKDKKGAEYFIHNAGISLEQGFKSRFNLSRPNWTAVYYQLNLGNRLTAGINYNNCMGFSDLGANFGFRLASLNVGLGSNSMLALINPDASRKLDLFFHLGLAL